MKPKRFTSIKRKITIIGLIIISIILIFVISTYLYIQYYINKINLVNDSDGMNKNVVQEQDAGYASNDANIDDTDIDDTDIDDTTIDDTNIDDTELMDEISPEEDNLELNKQEYPRAGISDTDDNEIAFIEKNSIPVKYDKNVHNILLIGDDTRISGGAGRSDAMILISINKKSKQIVFTSFLRDIYVKIPGKEINNRINASYAFGGADLLMDTLEENFRIQIDDYASIDFYAFIDLLDAVEGVTLEITKEDIPVINAYIKEINQLTNQDKNQDCLSVPGSQLLNGKQALGYVRNRYVGNSDFDRTARQRIVLGQVFNKIKKLKISQITKLLDTTLPRITTNLDKDEIFALILSLPDYINYNIEQWSIPMHDTYKSMRIRGMSVLGIDFKVNVEELHSKIYDIN